jgi:transcription elongation GreA/GreB family factor
MNRSKDRERFLELARKRVSRALNDIRLIGNLSNRSNYDYTDADAAKIMKALTEEIAACRDKFEAAKRPSKSSFELG